MLKRMRLSDLNSTPLLNNDHRNEVLDISEIDIVGNVSAIEAPRDINESLAENELIEVCILVKSIIKMGEVFFYAYRNV